MTIGTRIKSLRKAIIPDLSQAELGKAIGVGQSLIAYLESSSAPSPRSSSHLIEIAHFFNVDAYWLLTGEGNKEPGFRQPTAIAKNYCKEIEEVIKVMESTDDRGREKALIAVKDAVDAHRAWKKHSGVDFGQDANEINAVSSQLTQELLPESLQRIEDELVSNDVYSPENGGVRTGRHH